MKRYTKIIFVSLVLMLIVASTFMMSKLSNHQALLPENIRMQVSFVVYFPNGKQWRVDPDTIKYDHTLGVLGMTAVRGGTTLSITEQATPSQFSDLPEYYPTLISKLNGYGFFDTTFGHVDLTRPKETPQQTAVMNAKGTLLFARSKTDITTAEWRSLFDAMEVSQPIR